MASLYILNMTAAVALLFWPLWFSRRHLRLPLMNPLTIPMLLGLPVQAMKLFAGPAILIDDGLSDPAFQYAVLMGNLLVVAQTAGTVAFFRWFETLRIERYLPRRPTLLMRRDLRRASWWFLAIFVASFYLLASAEFGLANWLANPREGYQLYRSGQGHWYALAMTTLGASMVLSFLGRPTPAAILPRALVYFALAYLLGSKTVLLAMFGALLVFLWFVQLRHLGKLMLVGAPVVFALLVWNLYLALAESFDPQSVLEYFDYYKNAADYYREVLSGSLPLFHGDVAWSSLWAYVPRALWPEKPYVYGIVLVNEIFFPGEAELTNTPAFGGAVEQYADFGVAGVLAFGFFSVQAVGTALLSYLIFRRPGIDVRRITVVGALLMVVQFAPGYGTFFPGALYLILVAITAGGLRLAKGRTPRGRARSVGPSALAASSSGVR